MSDENGFTDFQLLEIKEAITGECIVLVDNRESEEEVLYISSTACSVECQTDPSCLLPNPGKPLWSIPIFFCAFPSCGEAATQCTIPEKVDVGIGTTQNNPACKEESIEIIGNEKSGGDGVLCESSPEIQTKVHTARSRNGAVSSVSSASEKSNSSDGGVPNQSRIKTEEQSPQVKSKRGRKRKIAPVTQDETKELQCHEKQIITHEDKSTRRRRKKKRDADFEYNLSDSEDERKIKLEVDDDYNDKDWIAMDEPADDEEEKSLINELIPGDQAAASELGLQVPAVKEEGSDESVDYKSLIDAVALGYGESSDDYEDGEDDWPDGDNDEIGDDETGAKNSQILRVGVSDLARKESKEFSKQKEKYLEKSREKYQKEKVVKAGGKVAFKCLKCNKEFDMRTQLNEHRKVHARKIKMYECDHCDKIFNDARKYYSHLAFHDRLFECHSCSRRFSLLGNLKKHVTIHPDGPHKVCDVCGFQFTTLNQLKVHQEEEHSGDHIRNYSCKCIHCGKEYVREEAYHQHLSKAPYICSICNESLGCEYQLQKHVRYQHNQCVCEYCGKSFKKNSLIHHIKLVHKEGKVQCPHCPKKFTYRCKMLAHIDANHTLEKKYKCNHCSYTARTVNTLNLHRRRYHMEPNKPRNYACKICGRKFFLPSKLTLHYRTHTGEKPFKCQTCGKGFAAKYNMMEHERCVHGERVQLKHPDGSTTVRVVKHRRAPRAPGRRCDLCGVDLPSSSAVLKHMSEVHGAEATEDDRLTPMEPDGKDGHDEEYSAEKCMVVDSQYEVMAGTEEDIILSSSSGMVSIRADAIPEYATHVEIDGIEYQVVRQ